jgi:hypothetical protein
MQIRKNRLTSYVEKTENLARYLSRKKKENIQNSMVRPLYQEALKSLFLVAVLLLDTLLPLEFYRSLPSPFHIISSLFFLGAFLYIEIVIYNLLWGKSGRWSLEKSKTLVKQEENKKP